MNSGDGDAHVKSGLNTLQQPNILRSLWWDDWFTLRLRQFWCPAKFWRVRVRCEKPRVGHRAVFPWPKFGSCGFAYRIISSCRARFW
jgi:hypothetical protein